MEIKWDLITELSNLLIFTPLEHRIDLKIEPKTGENLSYKKCFAGFP